MENKYQTKRTNWWENYNYRFSFSVMEVIEEEIEETIFSNRFMAVPELKRMGAKISVKKNKAIIIGQKKLNAADCISSDLRTTFSIILGAISAEGSSKISRIYHGLRGYENLQIKIKKLGIKNKMKK